MSDEHIIPAPMFGSEGREHFQKVIEAVRAGLEQKLSSKAVVFTGDGVGAAELAQAVVETGCKVIAVTFPFGRRFRHRGQDVPAGIVNPEVRATLERLEVPIVQGFPPFWEISVPDIADIKTTMIRHTLDLFGGGTVLCVQAVMMACDEGLLEAGETVIGVAADTAILASACYTENLFNPRFGMEIRAFLAKPGFLTTTKGRKYTPPEE